MLTDSDFDPDHRLKLANSLLFPKFCPTAVHSLPRHGTIRQTRDKDPGCGLLQRCGRTMASQAACSFVSLVRGYYAVNRKIRTHCPASF